MTARLFLPALIFLLPALPVAAATPPADNRTLSPSLNPSWWADDGRAAAALLERIESAEADGLDPRHYSPASLRLLLKEALAGRSRTKADAAFTRTLLSYAADVARPRDRSTLYVDVAAQPRPVSPARLLAVASAAPRFDAFIRTLGWMHPYYGLLRDEVSREQSRAPSSDRLRRLKLNLERARVLPRGPGAAIVVNTAAARLEYFADRKVQDSMRVVVGQAAQQTPMMAGLIRYAILNPYWHVPPDLAQKNIAPRVVKEGLGYFRARGYQVVSDWSNGAIIPEDSIDWKAVASGEKQVLVRQLPGPSNGMGEVKFMFPNDLGIYLHDTPSKGLFAKDDRQFSAGCVRLEDAKRLKSLLLGATDLRSNKEPEQVIALPQPVPVYLTYMTLFPFNGRIVERRDVYGRDRIALSGSTSTGLASR